MTDKERLQKIKNSHEERVKANEFYTLSFIHADWLIELAERVQELEIYKRGLEIEEESHRKTYKLLADSIEKQKSLQAELDENQRQDVLEELYEENGRLHEAVERAMSYVQNGRSPRANKMYEYFRGVLEESK